MEKRIRRPLPIFVALAVLAALVAGWRFAAPQVPTGSWSGRYVLTGDGSLAFSIHGRRASVALGVGHADVQSVALTRTGTRVRFELPGRPTPFVFDGHLHGRTIDGTVRQGSARGTFRVTRGNAPAFTARGQFVSSGRTLAVVDDPYGPARLVDLDTGEVHGVYPVGKGNTFAVGSGFATRTPLRGTLRLGSDGGTITAVAATRLPVRQLEVRFPGASAMLSGTLTLPVGPGRHAAVAFVHGSGPTPRAYLPDLQALLVRNGVAVLAYDKRGIGQSGGRYPGESPTEGTIAALARDAEAAARFLAAQPEVDPARVGLAGHSQAGWIMPLAASEERAIKELIVFSGPAITADENDLYQTLAGSGETPQQTSDAAIDEEVLRHGPGGVDPIPWIRKLAIPAIWLYGGLDKIIPDRLSVRRLEPIAREPGRDFTIAVFPNANHALVETRTGLTAEMLRSDRFAPGLFPRVAAWLRAHGLASG
jgi:uncharacterized protein